MTLTPAKVPHSTSPFGSLGRVGVLVPPANTTVEPELALMLPSGISLHAARLPGRVEEDTSIGLRERFLGYNATLEETADSFGGAPLDALVFACTGASYLVGPEGEADLRAAMKRSGVPLVHTAAGSVSDALSAIGARRVGLVSPYPEWLTQEAIGYWQASGFEVNDVQRIEDVVSIYAIDTEGVLAAAARLELSSVDAVVLSGTGMATADAIGPLAEHAGIPVLSSASCSAWWIVHNLAPQAIGQSKIVLQLDRWRHQ
jgi:maleate isomerase